MIYPPERLREIAAKLAKAKCPVPDMDACVVYTGRLTAKGYARVSIGNKELYLHRVVAGIKLGRKLTSEEVACHKCGVRRCCNPDHIYVGSIADNNRDLVAQGKHNRGKRKRKNNLTIDQVLQIKLVMRDHSATALAMRFTCGESTIRDIKAGRTWRKVHLPSKEEMERVAA